MAIFDLYGFSHPSYYPVLQANFADKRFSKLFFDAAHYFGGFKKGNFFVGYLD